jgi:pimeloyl-ACP methyl ester carboxylesterase
MMIGGLAAFEGGRGDRLLVLLHGMGATAGVWSRMLAELRWDGRWLALDLPGHGGSDHFDFYAVADQAAALVEAIGEKAAGAPITLLGHSLGGVLALAVAGGGHDLAIKRVLALGVKVDWTDEERARMDVIAARPPRICATREEALDAYRKTSGLVAGPVDPDLLARGVCETEDGWRLAMDNRAFQVGAFDFGALVAAARCPVALACGELDHMVSIERLRDFDACARSIKGASHNAMVDHPHAVWNWLNEGEGE